MKTKSKFKFPHENPTNNDWNSWFNFWHNFTSTGDKLKVPLGNWTHPTHCIWQWYYRAQDDDLQRIDGGTIYHYKLVLGHQRTWTTRMYHLAREEPFSPTVVLGLSTSTLGFSNQQVVKLSKGPALAQASVEIKNIWEFLHSWGGNWMWEGIDDDQETKEDATWIANGMRHNSLIWATDGSYNRKKASNLSGASWIIFCTRTGLQLVGTFWEKSIWANLYRVELARPLCFTLTRTGSGRVLQGGKMVSHSLLRQQMCP
jgi:hypothetical protein